MPNIVDVSIDPTFSVYRLVGRLPDESTMLQSRRGMNVISYEIENATIVDKASTRVFSSFQRMSRFLPQVERYRQLAARSNGVYVFGAMDVAMADLPEIKKLNYVPIDPNSQLAKEWFLVSYSDSYYSALVTEELSEMDDPDAEREFRGLWTFDLAMVSTLHEWLAGLVGISPHLSQMNEGAIDHERQVKLMSNTVGRLMQRVEL